MQKDVLDWNCFISKLETHGEDQPVGFAEERDPESIYFCSHDGNCSAKWFQGVFIRT